jgi:uncharacterized protein (TIGR03435 family)
MNRLTYITTILVLCSIPNGWAQSQNQATVRPAFEVASIKQSPSDAGNNSSEEFAAGGRFNAKNAPLRILIEVAWNVKENQVAGGSALLDSRYDIAAKADGEPERDRMRLMLRSLLADRFGLTLHNEMRENLVYAMVQDKGGIRMRVSPAELPADEDSRGITNGAAARSADAGHQCEAWRMCCRTTSVDPS